MANGRWVPPVGFEMPDGYGPWVGLCEGQPACAWVGPDDAVALEPLGVDSWFERMMAKHGGLEVGGEWIDRPVGSRHPRTATICSAISRGGQSRGEQPAPGEAGPGGPRRSALDS